MVSSISGSGSSNMLQQIMKQMQETKQKLKSADTDGTKGLSKDELSSINNDDDSGASSFIDMLKDSFSKVDSNGDGQLTQDEISAKQQNKLSQVQMGPPAGMFLNQADTDGTSGLSKDELSSISTGDDKASSKFVDTLKDNFDKVDSNGDGQLSKDEIKASHPHKHHMGPPSGMSIEGMSDDSNSSTVDNGTSNATGNDSNNMFDFMLKQYSNSSKSTGSSSSVKYAA